MYRNAWEEARVTAVFNKHKNLVKIGRGFGDMLAD